VASLEHELDEDGLRELIAEDRSLVADREPALVDVVTSQSVQSTDAQKGLGFVPDFQALTAWDDAEKRRREPR